MEETLSTLDYALRAKSIKNRPELNRRMTRAGLIKDYVHEIGTLKRDLIAAREKDGFYVSGDSWKAMQEEHEGTKTEADELRRGKEVVESKMNSLREQFEQNMQLLTKRDGEAKAAKAEFVEQSETLKQIKLRVEELLVAEEEERTLREAYQRSERKLSSVSDALNVLVGESTKDLGGLFGKLGELAA
jgi:kinesin family protein 11